MLRIPIRVAIASKNGSSVPAALPVRVGTGDRAHSPGRMGCKSYSDRLGAEGEPAGKGGLFMGYAFAALVSATLAVAPPSTANGAVTGRPATTCPAPGVPVPHGALGTTRVLGPTALGPLVRTPTGFLAADLRTGAIVSFSDQGTVIRTTQLMAGDLQHGVAVDAFGSIYAGRTPSTLVKYSPTGSLLWTRQVQGPVSSVFLIGRPGSQRIGVTSVKGASAQTFTPAGAPAGLLPIMGDSFATSPAGGVVATDRGRYVRVFDRHGHQSLYVGDSHDNAQSSPSGRPFQFDGLGGVAQLGDGRLLVTDARAGIMVMSHEGLVLGELAPSVIDPLGFTQRSAILVAGGFVYVETGSPYTANQSIRQFPLAQLLARATHGETTDPRLGIGAGLVMTNTDAYVRPGGAAVVRASFAPWWSGLASRLGLCWTLRSAAQLRDGQSGISRRVAVSALIRRGGVALPLPHHLSPGAYQLDAYLERSGKEVSTTRLIFTVGARWMKLNLDTLPAGAGWGGPTPARGLAIAAELGTDAFRFQLNLSTLFQNGSTTADVSSYLPELRAAAAEAQATGATLIVQVGQGGSDNKIVSDHLWPADVASVVSALKPYVHVWEAWNEPNNTFGAASVYVSDVLRPFSQAVHQVDPLAVVVGGSTVGVDLSYWKGIVAAGGLQWLNVAGVHPYTGHNRSWEENGTVDQLRALRALLDARGGAEIPLWNTEDAWWSNGPANLLGQADNSARAILWMRALGIAKWAYFLPEGGWGNDGVTFSAIQVGNYVKPAALAIMNTEHILDGRQYLGQVSLGLGSAYAMRFGPKQGVPGSSALLVAWTDGLRLPVTLTATSPGALTTTDEFGKAITGQFQGSQSTVIDSAPTYFSLHSRGSLAIASSERFGTDLALAAAGATATATSSLHSNPASAAIDGADGANGGGDLPSLPMWASAPGDHRPTLTVAFPHTQSVDRIIVATHSLGSIVPGLRSYDVDVRVAPAGRWRTVGRIRGQFYDRQALVRFPARRITALRIAVHSVNYSGYADGGAKPPFWPIDPGSLRDTGKPWYGPAVVAEVAAYAPANRR